MWQDRQIRVFVSSTFSDMQEERDLLVKKIFPQLRKMCEERGVTWTEVDLRWGITDEQKAERKVLPLCLEEIRRCAFFIGLLGERYGSVPESIPTDLLETQPWLKEHLQHSVTEVEMTQGVLSEARPPGHSHCYFRDPAYDGNGAAEDGQKADKLRKLKQKIRSAHERQACGLREGYRSPEQLGDWILEDWTALIDRIYPKEDVPEALDHEAARHEAYAYSRRVAFVGREELLRRLDEDASRGAKALGVTGEPGCGKSALLAEWVARWGEDHGEDLIIQHYIGSTPASADWQALVRRILGEIMRAFAVADELPNDPDALRGALQKWAMKTDPTRRVVLVLDALDQLADSEAARQLGWLPAVFPSNFRLLVSSAGGESLDALHRRGWPELRVPLFGAGDVVAAARVYFRMFSKTPPPDVVARLESTPAACNALYLRAVLDELRQFGRHEELKAKASHYLSAPDLPELYDRILARWDDDFGKEGGSPDLPGRALSLIARARYGLSEAELLDMLGRKNEQGENEPLPRRHWTPFYLAAENALALRAGLLNFGHDHLRAAVQRRYLSNGARDEYRQRIVTYLWGNERTRWWTTPIGSQAMNRVLDEVPWQLAEMQSWQMLYWLLAHLPLLKAAYQRSPLDVRRYWMRLERASPFRMTEAYRRALETPDTDEHRPYIHTLSLLFAATGHVLEASRLLTFATEKLRGEGTPRARAIALVDLAANVHELGDYRQALALLDEAEQICRESLDESDLGQILGEQGLNYHRLGDLDRALELLRKQEAICRESGEMRPLADCLANQASVYLEQGDAHRALALHRQVEVLRKESGDLHGLADSLNNQALACVTIDEWAKARSLLARHRKLCRTIGHAGGLADGLALAAEVARTLGKRGRAKTLLAMAATLNGSMEKKVKLAGILGRIAELLEEEQRIEDAVEALGQSLLYFAEAEDSRGAAMAASRHSMLLSTLGRHEEALSSLDLAIRLNPAIDTSFPLHGARAEALMALNEPQMALNAIDAVPSSLLETEDFRGPAHALRSKALRELERTEESLAAVQKAEHALEIDGQRVLLVEALILHARIVIFDVRMPKMAAPVLQRARSISQEDGLTHKLKEIEYLEMR